MTAEFPPRTHNLMLEAFATNATHAAAFEDDPGDTDTPASAEVSTGRVAVEWDTAAAGELDQTGTDVLTIGAGASANYVGFFTAITGGLYLGRIDTTDEMFTSEGDLTLSGLQITSGNDPA